ncbi:MAG: hydroxyacylglutathione hydrolase [Rickettsiaceae bacterium H1]|nr:hydroxyacylglutathione hydrolase [Rickettsiaceae bacterium H1]
MLSVKTIPILQDNYSYFICDNSTGITGIIDPPCAAPILKRINSKKLNYILNTHHHWDHTGGNLEVKKTKQAQVIGAAIDKDRIPGIDICVEKQFKFGNCTVDVLHVPGHTLGHIAFFFKEEKILFCGDTLFIAGCGRVFEGTMEQMYNSLQLLKNLPQKTKIYCGHEYTAYNIRFALSIEPNNLDLQNAYRTIKTLRKDKKPTIPSTIAQEKLINPFLRTNSEEIRSNINMINHRDLEVFTKIRHLKNGF